MAIKGFGATPSEFGGGNNVDLTTNVTAQYNTITTDNSDLRARIWSELVTRDAREKNVFDKFIGSEGSGKPIAEKTDLSAGGSDKVTFTTVAPIRGQGVRGEDVLKNKTGNLNFGTFNVEVDLIRHAVAWTQVLKLMRFTGKTLDQLSADVMSEWASRMEQDLIQAVLRDTCLQEAGNNLLNDYGATGGAAASIAYSEGISTDIIQEAKQALIANGGQPMNTGGDINQEIPGYLFFAPDACLRPLRSDPDYLEAITQADARGENNKLYSGSYAKWDNNVIANHNVIIDTAIGRQGSPLAPVAVMPATLGTQGWDATAAGVTNDLSPDVGVVYGGTGTDIWANFPGAAYTVPGGGGLKHVQRTATNHHVIIVDANKNYAAYKLAGFGGVNTAGVLTQTGSSYMKLGAQVVTGINTIGGGGQLAAGSLMTGPLTFYLANDRGTPIGYALAMGEGAMYLARGSVTNEQIFHYDDFANSGNEAHLSAVGLQSVYGMAAYQDTNGRVPGVVLVEAVRQIPGLSILAQP
jgi:N4-gp56 family major capsid protein